MRITSLAFENHPILGDLFLDLTDENGDPFQVVVLAGANGTGKTVILDGIYALLDRQWTTGFGKITAGMRLTEKEAQVTKEVYNDFPSDCRELEISWDSNIVGNWHAYKISWPNEGVDTTRAFVFGETKFNDVFKVFYNVAVIDFGGFGVSSVTSTGLDDDPSFAVRSGGNIGKIIEQLLVDIRSADNEDLSVWVRQNPGLPPPPSIVEPRIERFKSAFSSMFPAKRLSSVEARGGRHVVIFEEQGRESELGHLSTGEKQIVFRAGYLLRNLANLVDGIVLLDEPELSLHPEWQSKIVDFYLDVLRSQDGTSPQIIVATHSPFIVHGTPNARVVIMEKTADGRIQEMDRPTYAGVGSKLAVTAFNMDAFLKDVEGELLILCEGDSDRILIETAWRKLRPSIRLPFEIRSSFGSKNIQITLNDSRLAINIGDKRVIGVFDFDVAYNQWKGTWKRTSDFQELEDSRLFLVKKNNELAAWAALLPVPEFRSDWANDDLGGNSILSIEFLFRDHVLNSFVEYRTGPLGQQTPYIPDSKKTHFAREADSLDVEEFIEFEPLIRFFEWVASNNPSGTASVD